MITLKQRNVNNKNNKVEKYCAIQSEMIFKMTDRDIVRTYVCVTL